ncbi:hypothetical protein K461DRAFT_291712 [Myriangium duriaei CBS 260.36]|uniref:Uncharacterized protein n=1 Tax=Myriangium duriaei CBS 260.36 TaxID=1168546 RepID=A0A9P4MM31_9PEZI|nr:hypothetical protein K461DRAFT_291712 [Myriangium duriaei CBS 260.36]
MGTSHSKSHSQNDDQVKAVRRQIGKRSSINFLQRLESRPLPPRPVSFAARTTEPDAELLFQAPLRPLTSHPMTQPSSFPALSPSSTATVVRAKDYLSPELAEDLVEVPKSELTAEHLGDQEDHVSETSVDKVPVQTTAPNYQSDGDDSSNGSHENYSVPLETPQLSDGSTTDEPQEIHESDPMLEDPFDDNEGSEPGTPVARALVVPLTPVLRMPTPLAQDSPTRYGFNEAMETARVAVTREMHKKRASTGPELFRQALDLQISSGFVNSIVEPATIPMPAKKPVAVDAVPCRVYRPPRSRYPPSEIFRRAQLKYHPLPPPRAKEFSPRTARLLRRGWPQNLVRDDITPVQNVRYALALPLTHTQRFCPGGHGSWHETSNFLYPVECAICLCASDCPTDTAVSWMCELCHVRICAECRAVFDSAGIVGLMDRFADGSDTIEAKKAKMNRRSVV